MIVSDVYEYVFVEVPATASTAISDELRRYYGGKNVLYKHANYTEFLREATPAQKRYFVFAGVRNPLDAVVSHYIKLKTNFKGVYTDPVRFKSSFPETHRDKFQFLQRTGADFPAFLRHFYRSPYNEWVLLGHRRFGFVLRFERVAQDFATVLRHLGIEPVRQLPVVNAAGREEGFAQHYSPEIRRHAVHVFGPFMRKWGYSFPAGWNVERIPHMSRLAFAAIDTSVNLIATHTSLSPRSPAVQQMKSLARRLRLA